MHAVVLRVCAPVSAPAHHAFCSNLAYYLNAATANAECSTISQVSSLPTLTTSSECTCVRLLSALRCALISSLFACWQCVCDGAAVHVFWPGQQLCERVRAVCIVFALMLLFAVTIVRAARRPSAPPNARSPLLLFFWFFVPLMVCFTEHCELSREPCAVLVFVEFRCAAQLHIDASTAKVCCSLGRVCVQCVCCCSCSGVPGGTGANAYKSLGQSLSLSLFIS